MTSFFQRIIRSSALPALGVALALSACTATTQPVSRVAAIPLDSGGISAPVATPVNYQAPDATTMGDQLGGIQPAIYRPEDSDAEPMFTKGGVPSIRANSFLLIDAHTGKTLASRNADTPRGVASTQKLVTAMVVIEAGDLDKRVRVQESDVRVEPTCLGVRPGEIYTRRELLYAFLVKSCNDVANVLARDNAGSISAFAAKMNAKARSLGCTSSSFRTPHGLTAPGQFSTARDMSKIAMAAYRSGIIRDIVRRKYYTFHRANGQVVTLKSTNELLGRMSECNGMKTGYTGPAGRCLISSATRGGRDVILVQLGTKTKYIWDDARMLMTWGLQKTKSGGSLAMLSGRTTGDEPMAN